MKTAKELIESLVSEGNLTRLWRIIDLLAKEFNGTLESSDPWSRSYKFDSTDDAVTFEKRIDVAHPHFNAIGSFKPRYSIVTVSEK